MNFTAGSKSSPTAMGTIPGAGAGAARGYATKRKSFHDSSGSNRGSLGQAAFTDWNDRPATTLWRHDHTLAMTHAPVYAGPAAFWLTRGGPYDHPTVAGTATDGVASRPLSP